MSAGARTRIRAQQQMSGGGGNTKPAAPKPRGSPLARQHQAHHQARNRQPTPQQRSAQQPTQAPSQMPLEDVLKTFWNRILENNDEQVKYITDLSQRLADLEESPKQETTSRETNSDVVASSEIQSQINDLNLKYTQLNNLLIEIQTTQLTINNQLLNKFNANADGLVNAVSQSNEAAGEVVAAGEVEAEQEAVPEEAEASNTNDTESEIVATPENVLEATATDEVEQHEEPNEEPNEEENVTLNIGKN